MFHSSSVFNVLTGIYMLGVCQSLVTIVVIWIATATRVSFSTSAQAPRGWCHRHSLSFYMGIVASCGLLLALALVVSAGTAKLELLAVAPTGIAFVVLPALLVSDRLLFGSSSWWPNPNGLNLNDALLPEDEAPKGIEETSMASVATSSSLPASPTTSTSSAAFPSLSPKGMVSLLRIGSRTHPQPSSSSSSSRAHPSQLSIEVSTNISRSRSPSYSAKVVEVLKEVRMLSRQIQLMLGIWLVLGGVFTLLAGQSTGGSAASLTVADLFHASFAMGSTAFICHVCKKSHQTATLWIEVPLLLLVRAFRQ